MIDRAMKQLSDDENLLITLFYKGENSIEDIKTAARLGEKVAARYKEVILDSDYLKYVANNARKWYIENISYPVVIDNIIKSLDL